MELYHVQLKIDKAKCTILFMVTIFLCIYLHTVIRLATQSFAVLIGSDLTMFAVASSFACNKKFLKGELSDKIAGNYPPLSV